MSRPVDTELARSTSTVRHRQPAPLLPPLPLTRQGSLHPCDFGARPLRLESHLIPFLHSSRQLRSPRNRIRHNPFHGRSSRPRLSILQAFCLGPARRANARSLGRGLPARQPPVPRTHPQPQRQHLALRPASGQRTTPSAPVCVPGVCAGQPARPASTACPGASRGTSGDERDGHA